MARLVICMVERTARDYVEPGCQSGQPHLGAENLIAFEAIVFCFLVWLRRCLCLTNLCEKQTPPSSMMIRGTKYVPFQVHCLSVVVCVL